MFTPFETAFKKLNWVCTHVSYTVREVRGWTLGFSPAKYSVHFDNEGFSLLKGSFVSSMTPSTAQLKENTRKRVGCDVRHVTWSLLTRPRPLLSFSRISLISFLFELSVALKFEHIPYIIFFNKKN